MSSKALYSSFFGDFGVFRSLPLVHAFALTFFTLVLGLVLTRRLFAKTPHISVTISRDPLSPKEKNLLIPDLQRRHLSTDLLDVLPTKGKTFFLLRAYSHDNKLLAITTLFNVYPFVSLKNMLGEGNHVGWDTSFYYTTYATTDNVRAQSVAALLTKTAERCWTSGGWFGPLWENYQDALPYLRYYRLFRTNYEAGSISTKGLANLDDYLTRHKQLAKHVRQFRNAGCTLHVLQGPLHDHALITQFADCVASTYKRHWPPKQYKHQVKYAYDTCVHFLQHCPRAVHIYALDSSDQMIGCQSFISHAHHLELSEGGFQLIGKNGHYAYETIIAESVKYCIQHELDRVSYGGIWNDTKGRYADKDTRVPIYQLHVFDAWWKYALMGCFTIDYGKIFPKGAGAFSFVESSSSRRLEKKKLDVVEHA